MQEYAKFRITSTAASCGNSVSSAFHKLTYLDSYTGAAENQTPSRQDLKKWKLQRLIRKLNCQLNVPQLVADTSWLAPRKRLVFGILGNKYSYVERGSDYDGWAESWESSGLQRFPANIWLLFSLRRSSSSDVFRILTCPHKKPLPPRRVKISRTKPRRLPLSLLVN